MSGRHRSTRESIDARIDRLGQTRSIGRVDSSRRGFARLQTQKKVGARTIARGLARVRECGARGCRREREKMSWTQLRARIRARCLNEAGFGAPRRQTAAQVHPPPLTSVDQTNRPIDCALSSRSVGPSQSVELRSIGLLSIDRSVGPHQAGSPPPWRVGRASQPSPQLCVVLIAVAAAIAPPNLRLGRSALTVAEAKKSTRSIDRSVDRSVGGEGARSTDRSIDRLSPVTASSTSWFLHARRRQHSHSRLNSRRHLPSRR